MLYTLVAFYTLTHATYIEGRNLTIQHCAGRAAMGRIAYSHVRSKTGGDVRYLCLPQQRFDRRVDK